MPPLVAMVDEALATRSRDEWGAIFDEAGIIWGPVLGLDEVVADPQAEALDLFPTLVSPDIGEYRTVANPLKFKTADVGPQGPHPKLGEHAVGGAAEPRQGLHRMHAQSLADEARVGECLSTGSVRRAASPRDGPPEPVRARVARSSRP